MKVILASNNKGKIKEFKEILLPYNIDLVSLKEIGFNEEIVEDGNTFFDNALIKAKTLYDIYKLPVIADDSGLCVDALGGEPGIYSARYGGLKTDLDRLHLVLKNMEGEENRKAYFCCSLVFYISDNNYHNFDGRVDGSITTTKEGEGGFGYDPIFIPNGYSETFGVLENEIKNKMSHRYNAIKKFVEYLENDFNN